MNSQCYSYLIATLDDLDDVGLLFDGLGEVGHGRVCIEDKAGGKCKVGA